MTPCGALHRQSMFVLFRAHGAAALFSLIAVLAISLYTSSQAQNLPTEYELKAAFLYNFAKFVEWPPAKSPPDDGRFLVGVLGDDPFGPDLEKIISGKQVNGRPVTIVRSRNEKQLAECHILFISVSERRRIGQILEALRGSHVLTVSEIDRFCPAPVPGARPPHAQKAPAQASHPAAVRSEDVSHD